MTRTMLFLIAVAATPSGLQERAQIIAPDGTILATIGGDESSVRLDAAVDALLRQTDVQLRVTHNHPSSHGLSGADLEQLAKGGVDVIEAVGADGSRYEAMRGSCFDANRLIASQYAIVEAAVTRFLSQTRRASDDRAEIDAHVAHLVALALEKARVIQYRSRLAQARAASYRRYGVMFGYAAELGATRIRSARNQCVDR